MTRESVLRRFLARARTAMQPVARLREVPSFDAEFDRLETAPPALRFAICSTPRSGSTLLCHYLWRLGVGMPAEYFNERWVPMLLRRWRCRGRLAQAWDRALLGNPLRRPATRASYLEQLERRRTTANGAFGFKLHHAHWRAALAPVGLSQLFPGLVVVAMRRRDRLRQAISWVRALQTERFRASQPEKFRSDYSRQAVETALAGLADEEGGWSELFEREGVSSFQIDYEDLVERPEATVFGLLDRWGFSAAASRPLPTPSLARQADAVTEEWLARFAADQPAGSLRAGP